MCIYTQISLSLYIYIEREREIYMHINIDIAINTYIYIYIYGALHTRHPPLPEPYGQTANEETRNSEFEPNTFLSVEGGFP